MIILARKERNKILQTKQTLMKSFSVDFKKRFYYLYKIGIVIQKKKLLITDTCACGNNHESDDQEFHLRKKMSSNLLA